MTQKFGHEHTEKKLDAVSKYLETYTTALSKQKFKLIYFDAFAGTGQVDISGDNSILAIPTLLELIGENNNVTESGELDKFTDGSAKRALQIPKKFDEYYFVEKDSNKFQQLVSLKNEFPKLANSITCINGDANNELKQFCENTNWRNTRAVVFLDPFGSQVNFDTIKLIATTRAIDLWYLFPSFLSVYRQISATGQTTVEQESSITRIIGANDWKNEWTTKETEPTLFGDEEITSKQVGIDDITRYMISRMRREFKGGVLDEWLPLGRDGAHWYSLLFAWANPSPKAKLAAKLAKHVMSRK